MFTFVAMKSVRRGMEDGQIRGILRVQKLSRMVKGVRSRVIAQERPRLGHFGS